MKLLVVVASGYKELCLYWQAISISFSLHDFLSGFYLCSLRSLCFL